MRLDAVRCWYPSSCSCCKMYQVLHLQLTRHNAGHGHLTATARERVRDARGLDFLWAIRHGNQNLHRDVSVWFISSFHSQKYHTVGTWLPCHCLNWLEAWKRFIKSSSLEKPRLCHGEVNLRVTRSSLSQKLRVGNQRSKSGCLFTVRQEFQCLYKRNTHQMLEIKPGEPKTTSI